MVKRAAIIGTAQSWKQAPFADPGITIVSLNDAYMLELGRVDEWYELHPVEKFYYRKKTQKTIDAKDVPKGHYIRPDGHLDWLKSKAVTMPVWLKETPPDDWPVNAQRFPIEAIEAKYGTYWASGPSYILAHLYERGYRHIEIYGIHLSTHDEYRDQRPQFENLIGRLLGAHVTETIDGEKRIFTGADFTLVLPKSSPIMQHGWKYAYEPKPQPTPNPYRDELAQVRAQKEALVNALVYWPAKKDKTSVLDELSWLEIVEMDCAQQLQKSHIGETIVAVRT